MWCIDSPLIVCYFYLPDCFESGILNCSTCFACSDTGSQTDLESYITTCINNSSTPLSNSKVSNEQPCFTVEKCDAVAEYCTKPAVPSTDDASKLPDDEAVDLALVSHFLADLTSQGLSPGHKVHMKSKFSADTIDWISQLFR